MFSFRFLGKKRQYNIKFPPQRKVKFGPVSIFLIDDSEIILVQATVSQDHPSLVLFTNQFIVPCVGPLHVNKTNFTVFCLFCITPFILPIALYNLQQLKEELCVLYLSSAIPGRKIIFLHYSLKA